MPRTIRVRIPVAINGDGTYVAHRDSVYGERKGAVYARQLALIGHENDESDPVIVYVEADVVLSDPVERPAPVVADGRQA